MERHGLYRLITLVLFILLITSIPMSCKRKVPCNLETKAGCPAGTVCEKVGTDKGVCLYDCEPDADEPCMAGEVCLRYADGTHACTPSCSPGSITACSNDWVCAPATGGEYVCWPECDLAGALCDADEVCQPLSDGVAFCRAQCDPLSPSECGEAWTCELRTDGLYACYEAVSIRGTVFDSASENPIAGAHVIAVDKTGAAATDVAITGSDGVYELQVPVVREPDGSLDEGIYTLRISAPDYLPYPHGIRPALPVDAAQATYEEDGGWLLENAATGVALIALKAEEQGRGSISGSIVVAGDTSPAGVLVVLEGTPEGSLFSFSDKSGRYTLFNVPEGSWQVQGYKAFLQLDAVTVTVGPGEDKTGIDLASNAKPYGTVTGSINIVNAPGGSATSVVLVPESTFNETFVKGEVPPGLRAPAPPESPSITGGFTIEGVPDGQYVVFAAFENDFLVRDPDPSIAGTQILHIQVPDGSSYEIDIASSFKVTESLVVLSPGATAPEPVTGNPVFIWEDDSSEIKYSIVVYNAFGEEVWRDDDLPRVTGSPRVTVTYGAGPLQAGMYYQFRATSWRSDGPISQTEDLLGVFYTAAD